MFCRLIIFYNPNKQREQDVQIRFFQVCLKSRFGGVRTIFWIDIFVAQPLNETVFEKLG